MSECSTGPSKPDPLIDEIRAIRKEISDQFGNDVRRLGEHLREIDQDLDQREGLTPKLEPRRPT
jgi:hypothetical protein